MRCPEPHYKGALRCVTLAWVEADDGLVGWGSAYLTVCDHPGLGVEIKEEIAEK